MLASIGGGEMASRLARHKVVAAIMVMSCLLAFSIGFAAQLPYRIVILLCILYTLFFQGDSAAIHAGVITAAESGRRGATMALQSLAGFAAASLGSLVTGIVLDLTGGGTTTVSWGLTFCSLGVVSALGLIMLKYNLKAAA